MESVTTEVTTEQNLFVSPDTNKPLNFSTQGKYIDWLLKSYTEIINEETELAAKKQAFRIKINSLIVDPKIKGTVVLEGDSFKAKVVRKVNVTYLPPEDKDAPSWLQQAYTNIAEIREAIAVKFEERTAAMDKFLESKTEYLKQIVATKEALKLSKEDDILLHLFLSRQVKQSESPDIKVETK